MTTGTGALSQIFVQIQNSSQTYGSSMAAKIMPYGLELFAGFAVLLLAWEGIKIVLEGGVLADIWGGLLRSLFLIGFCYWMLGAGTAQGYLDNVIGPISSLLDSVADTLAYGDGTYGESIVSGANALVQMLDSPMKTFDALFAKDYNWLHAASIIQANLFIIVLAVAEWILILVSVVIYIVLAAAGLILISFATAIGPLFIPFLLFEPLRNFFSGWFDFFVGACLYKVVAAGLVGITTAILTAIPSMIEVPDINAQNWTLALELTSGRNFMVSILAAAMAALSAYMMLQVPAIARGLMSGSAAANLGGIANGVSSKIPSFGGNDEGGSKRDSSHTSSSKSTEGNSNEKTK